MKFDNIDNKRYTTTEGEEKWHSRSITVVGMILMEHNDETYVILGKRGDASPNEVGKYCMPCGFLDFNETCEEAVVREIYEESGFNVYKATERYNVIHDQMHFPWRINSTPDSEAQNVSMHYALYLNTDVLAYGDVPELPELTIENNAILDEVSEIKWVKIEDLHLYDLAFGHESIIKIYMTERKTHSSLLRGWDVSDH